ncbi:hypothetical protein VOLCADRAFT_106422 [Volvox carteri f. nagariensis]|uniref:VASt domain-containing protein n=1 Tax=Volvox carteri f. nagariensis TaxID=3068 RepID=D8U784_VOLCA|nr:uncharacterized protein VOLCADRAFT_106422 [Volvox carteri f. nagariensis]EFJ44378.1 hypothetical protein VOLCADRAFT_106422 [Volvox carteri f. nagariensis]|eukprot:XP_002954485.1 hypothetical protein VOLCADRAFT_106422 [Volvox carteri f. nagariensis]
MFVHSSALEVPWEQRTGLAIIFPITPTLMTNGFASLAAGHRVDCTAFSPADSPRECVDAHGTVVMWMSWTNFISSSLLTFLCAPFVGQLSDRIGRKPFMLIGVGLMFLPLLVILLHLHDVLPIYWYYPASAVGGAVSSFTMTLTSVADLMEQKHSAASSDGAASSATSGADGGGGRLAGLSSGFAVIRHSPFYRRIALIWVVVSMTWEGAGELLMQYLQYKLGYNTTDQAHVLTVLASGGLVVKLGFLAFLVRWLGERRLLAFGLAAYAAECLALAAAPTKAAGLAAVSIGSLSSTAGVDPHHQGAVFGALQAISSMASGLGPLLFASVFAQVTRAPPPPGDPRPPNPLAHMPGLVWYLAAAMTAVAIALALSLPEQLPGRGLRGKKGPHARAAKPQRQQSAAAGAPHSPQAAAGEDSWTPVDAPPPATPDGYKPIVTAVLSCTPQELYGILFSSSGTELFLRQHREIGGQWDVVATAWRRAPTAAVSIGTAAGKDAEGSTASAAVAAADGSLLGPQSVFEWVLGKPGSGGATFTRLLTFWNPRKPPSSTDTRCVQRQQFCVYEGGMLLFATAMNMLDIPFKECFTVNSLWRTKPGARPGTTELTIHMKVHFVKRAMGVGGIISATTIRDSTSFYNAFIANVETHIKAIRQQAAAPLPKPLPVSAPVGGSVPGTPRRSRSAAAAAAAAGGIAPQAPTAAAAPAPVAGAHLRQPLPIWKQSLANLAGNLERYAEAVADALVDVWHGKASAEQALQMLDSEALSEATPERCQVQSFTIYARTCLMLWPTQVIWHDALLPDKALVGRYQLQELVDLFRGAMSDLSLQLQRPLHTGEQGLVLGYWKATGTHTGALGPSLPPSGATASWEGSLVIRTAQPVQGLASAAPTNDEVATATAPPNDDDDDGGEAASTVPELLRGVEVWWSWDPIFLYRQLGWQQQQGHQEEPQGPDGGAAVKEARRPSAAEGDLAMRTAAVARNAFATEAEAAEAAAAAVAAAAEAQAHFAESPEALAAAQAANRAVVELYFHTYNTGNYKVLDHIVHPDYQYDGLLDLGDRRGREAMEAMMGGWRDCLPDLAIGHELFAALGFDKVTFRWVIRGTHTAAGSKLLGVPAAGAPLLVRGVTTLTLRGGRIARKVSHANAAHTLQQLGAAVHPAITLPLQTAELQPKQE